MKKIASVKCASPDAHLHLAPYEDGIGTERHTLCLEKWTKHEKAREDSQLCPVCVEKWNELNQPKEHRK